MVWGDPIEGSVWFGKALPRVGLEEGEDVTVSGASSAYGRVGLAIRSSFRSAKTISANVPGPASWAESGGAPSGGLRLRRPTKSCLRSGANSRPTVRLCIIDG